MIPYEYDGPRTSVSMERTFQASPEALFDAWVTPAVAERWLFHTKTSKTKAELDPRPGGAYKVTRTRSGKTYVAVGEYSEVVRPSRLVFTFGMPQFVADFDTVIVDIEPAGDGARLRFKQHGLRPGYEKSTLSGWEKMFDLLEAALRPQGASSSSKR